MRSEAVENGDGETRDGEKKVGGKLVITDERTERGSDRRQGGGEGRLSEWIKKDVRKLKRERERERGKKINVAKGRDGLRGRE